MKWQSPFPNGRTTGRRRTTGDSSTSARSPFLKKNGYDIDDDLLKNHLEWVTSYHAGNGWYLEQTYNYYTISLFVVYGHQSGVVPSVVSIIRKSRVYSSAVSENCSRHIPTSSAGTARSTCGPGASAIVFGFRAVFPSSFMLASEPPIDPGWARRRLCSGSILQFTGREDFYENDIPSLGFYPHREFAIQNYSCSAVPIHHVFAIHKPGAAGRLSILDRERERRNVGRLRKALATRPCWNGRALFWSTTVVAVLPRSSRARCTTTITTTPSWCSTPISRGKTIMRTGAHRRSIVSGAWILGDLRGVDIEFLPHGASRR